MPDPADDPTEPAITTALHGAVAVVTISRPPHNLLDQGNLARLADALHESAAHARAAVLCSVGRSFCAGADFRSPDGPDPTDGTGFASRTASFYRQAARVFDVPIPIVAAVHGAAIGAGFGLALACDLRVVSSRTWFQANFVNLGIHPGFALSATLPKLIGPGRAADVLLTGRRVSGDEAIGIGLAERLADPGAELALAMEIAGVIASAAPQAVRATRATLRAHLADLAAKAMAHELDQQRLLAGTADAVEGTTAMLEKRTPVFTGR